MAFSIHKSVAVAAALFALAGAGCAVLDPNYPGRVAGPKYLDPREPSALDTAGVESADIVTACNVAVGKMLASPAFLRIPAPVVAVDPEYVVVNDAVTLEPQALADLLRNELLNAAAGRIRVVHEPYANIPAAGEAEDEIDQAHDGNMPRTPAIAPDFVVGASVTEVSNTADGVTEAYTQINVQAVSATTREVVFSDIHSFKKAAAMTLGGWSR